MYLTAFSSLLLYAPFMLVARSDEPLIQLYAAVMLLSATLSVWGGSSDMDHAMAVAWGSYDIFLASYLRDPLLALFVIVSNVSTAVLSLVADREPYEWNRSLWHVIFSLKSLLIAALLYGTLLHVRREALLL